MNGKKVFRSGFISMDGDPNLSYMFYFRGRRIDSLSLLEFIFTDGNSNIIVNLNKTSIKNNRFGDQFLSFDPFESVDKRFKLSKVKMNIICENHGDFYEIDKEISFLKPMTMTMLRKKYVELLSSIN
jgi:hypothetical protein